MTNTHRDGLAARQATALALRSELGLPAAATATAAITFASLDAPTLVMLEAMGRKAIRDRQDALISLYRDVDASEPVSFALIYRTLVGVQIIEVHPFETGKADPLVLVTTDGDRQFAIDERGVLRECLDAVVKSSKRGRTRALQRVRKTAAHVELNGREWKTTTFGLRPEELEGPASKLIN